MISQSKSAEMGREIVQRGETFLKVGIRGKMTLKSNEKF